MNLVSRNGRFIVIRQIPFLLLFCTAFFSLPLLAYSFLNILSGTDADGKIFTMFLGIFMLWIFLEFVATRERIDIDLDRRILKRSVSGVFKRRKQLINLRDVSAIVLENKRVDGKKRQYLYMYGSDRHHLMNSPSMLYINHAKLGRILSEATGIPFEEQKYVYD